MLFELLAHLEGGILIIAPKKQDKQRSPKIRLPGAPPAPSRGVYVFVGFFGSIAKVGLGNSARFSEKYAWENKRKPHREAQRMAHIITTEHGGWIFEKSATDAEAEERKIMELLSNGGTIFLETKREPTFFGEHIIQRRAARSTRIEALDAALRRDLEILSFFNQP
jgi:hypothetical protein